MSDNGNGPVAFASNITAKVRENVSFFTKNRFLCLI